MTATDPRSAWADTVLRVLTTPWPWAAGHMSRDEDDCHVTPWRLHPSFHGALDWHSSCHLQWSAIRLVDSGAPIDRDTRAGLLGQLDARLSPANLEVESAYLHEHPGFERPYGWGWAARLAAAAATSAQDAAPRWARALQPLADTVARLTLMWLPRQVLPVRHGVHQNSAFGLTLLRDGFVTLGRADVVAAIDERARDWFLGDRDCPSQWEPSGTDFLSPALSEADLMRRLLGPEGFSDWLADFLPGLGEPGDRLLEVPEVGDVHDGAMVHQFGLALSRAAQLRALRPYLPAERAARVDAAASALVDAVAPQITSGDFMSTHWLVSFALLAAGA